MVNDSLACNHFHFMKMSDLDKFKESIWQKHRKNHDLTPKFGAKMQFILMNDSFACNHYPFMKMSDLDDFKGRIL